MRCSRGRTSPIVTTQVRKWPAMMGFTLAGLRLLDCYWSTLIFVHTPYIHGLLNMSFGQTLPHADLITLMSTAASCPIELEVKSNIRLLSAVNWPIPTNSPYFFKLIIYCLMKSLTPPKLFWTRGVSGHYELSHCYYPCPTGQHALTVAVIPGSV